MRRTAAVLTVSLLLNVLVLVPVVFGLLAGAVWCDAAYGPRSPARQVLLSVYLAILLMSLSMLVWCDASMACGLLFVQVVYKVLTPFAVGTLRHPVVISNLAIAAVHAVTLVTVVPRS